MDYGQRVKHFHSLVLQVMCLAKPFQTQLSLPEQVASKFSLSNILDTPILFDPEVTMTNKLRIEDLRFCDDQLALSLAVKGGAIRVPSLGIGTAVGLQPSITLKTEIAPRSANYAYGVAVGSGAAVGFSIDGQAVAAVVVGGVTF